MKRTKDYKVNKSISKTPVGGRKPLPVLPQIPVPPPVVQQVAPKPQIAPIPKPIPAPIQKPIAPPIQAPVNLAPKKEIETPDATSSQVIELTNLYRTKQNLPTLTFNPSLSKSAKIRAEYIAQTLKDRPVNTQDHIGTDLSTTSDSYIDTITGQGYRGLIGENIAKDFPNLNTTFNAWQRSKLHNDNILNNQYQDIGIGWAQYIDKNGKTQTVFVQHFGKRK